MTRLTILFITAFAVAACGVRGAPRPPSPVRQPQAVSPDAGTTDAASSDANTPDVDADASDAHSPEETP